MKDSKFISDCCGNEIDGIWLSVSICPICEDFCNIIEEKPVDESKPYYWLNYNEKNSNQIKLFENE